MKILPSGLPRPRSSVVELLGSVVGRWWAAQPSRDPYTPPAPARGTIAVHWIDWRDRPKTKERGKRKSVRKWSSITGITLHQTAVAVRTPERCLNMPVHAVVLDGGPNGEDATIVLLHDPIDYMWHGNGFNRHDIGIEVSARAAGIEGDGRTLWLPEALRNVGSPLDHAVEATDAQLEACRMLLRYYVEQASDNGGRIEYIHAHRQSSASRVSDPGSRIWRACGAWAKAALGLKTGPADFAIGGGNPLPDAWTGEANGQPYNWQVKGEAGEPVPMPLVDTAPD